MATATLATTITAQDMSYLGHSVYSSAMRSWALVTTNEGEPHLLILFREGGTVYRYAFRSWEDANDWDSLRDAENHPDAEPVSWGRCFHRFLKEGAILSIAA